MYNGTLSIKGTIHDAEGNEVVDICAPAISYDKLLDMQYGTHFVTDDEAMRVDKVAFLYFGDTDKIDSIMWLNDIYNPFAVDEFEILAVPNARTSDAFYHRPIAILAPDEEVETTQSKISDASSKLNTAVNGTKTSNSNSTIPLKRSNTIASGKSAKIVDGGVIYLGTTMPQKK